MAPNLKLDTPKRMGAGFTGILLVAGVAFYIAKRNIAEKRRLDLEGHRPSQAQTQALSPSTISQHSTGRTN